MCSECASEEDDTVHRKGSHPSLAKEPTTVGFTERLQGARNRGGRPLPEGALTFAESSFGHDFAAVRIHHDEAAAELSDAIDAKAFTIGNDIFFGRGAFEHRSAQGRHLLAHELTHVLQQRSSPVAARRIMRQARFPGAISRCREMGVPCPAPQFFGGQPCRLMDCIPAVTARLPGAISPGVCVYECADGTVCACVLVGTRTSAVCTFRICAPPTDRGTPTAPAPPDPIEIAQMAVEAMQESGGSAEEPSSEPSMVFARSSTTGRQDVFGQAAPPGATGAAANSPVEMIERARSGAFARCVDAKIRLTNLGPPPPPGRGDPGALRELENRRLVRTIFGEDLNMDQVREIVGRMLSAMGPGLRTIVAPATDRQCGNRAAYVVGLSPPVHLCPSFFAGTDEERTRTMVHEAAHLARIGEAGLGESYCAIFDCQTSCGGFDTADSWAHLVHCLSGASPDEPEVVEGRSGGRQGP